MCLAPLISHRAFVIHHIVVCINFYSWMVFLCMGVVHSFIYQFKKICFYFPKVFGVYKCNYYKYLSTGLCENKYLFLLQKFLRVELLGHMISNFMVCLILCMFRNFEALFQTGYTTLLSLQQCLRVSVALCS